MIDFKFQFFFERVSTIGTTRKTSCHTFGVSRQFPTPFTAFTASVRVLLCMQAYHTGTRTRLTSGRLTAHLINHYNPKPAHPECITRGNLTTTSFELGIEWVISTAVD